MSLLTRPAVTRSAAVVAAAAHVVDGVVRARLSRHRRAARGNHGAHYRALWTDAAARVGATTAPAPGGALAVTLPGSPPAANRTIHVRGTHVSLDGPAVMRLAGDKVRVAQLLAADGLPVPPGVLATLSDLSAAEEFLRAAPGPCVVKPARDTAAGRGVTTSVHTVRDLRRAAAAAAAAGVRGTVATSRGGPAGKALALLTGLAEVPLLVEHQVPGANYRLLYLDGELVDAIRRDPPTVVGDGVHTIARLVDDLNAARLRRGGGHGQVLVGRDLDLDATLRAQGLDPRSVPAAGTEVQVKTAVNENAPDSNFPARDDLCPELVEQGRRAAAAVGARLAGVDVITTDPSVPLGESGGCVLEVNTTPGLAMHYHGHAGAADPATALLRRLCGAQGHRTSSPTGRGARVTPTPDPDTAVDRPPVIVLGGESNALSVARQLGRMGVAVYGLGTAAFVAYSRYLTAIPCAGGSGEDAMLETLLGPRTAHLRGAVVLAGSDAGLTVLARHRERLGERYLLDVSDTTAQLGMLDKLTTYEWAVEGGVPTPKFWRVDSADDLDRVRDELVFPLILKPIHSHAYQAAFPGLSKFRVVDDVDALAQQYRALGEAGIAVMLVEKIPGPDDLLCSYYTYIDATGTSTFDFTKRIIRRHPPNMGIATYHVTDWNPEVRDVALRLFKHVGLRGLANAEFKRDVRDGQLKLIECNARLTAANCLVAAAGLDLARYVYLQVTGRPEPLPDTYRTGLRLLYPSNDLRAFRDLHAAGELSLPAWLASLAHRQTFPYADVRDPAPALARGLLRLVTGARRGAAARRS